MDTSTYLNNEVERCKTIFYTVMGMHQDQQTETEFFFEKEFSDLENAKIYFEKMKSNYPDYTPTLVKQEPILTSY